MKSSNLTMIVVAAAIVGLIFLVRYLSGIEIKRIPLAIRILTKKAS